MSPISKIKKRDGTVVDFDHVKIRIAMEKAARSVNPLIDTRSFSTLADHAVRHVELAYPTSIPEVEKVQDLVERTLMEYGLFDVAKSYILYRAERAKVRKEAVTEVAPAENAKISYRNEAGELKLLDRRRLRSLFQQAIKSAGSPANVSLETLVEHAESNLYDGMTYQELSKAMALAARALIERDPGYSKVASQIVLHALYFESFGVTDADDSMYAKHFATNLQKAVDEKRVDPELLNFDLETLAKSLKLERDGIFDFMGTQVLYDRYFIRVLGGDQRLEAPQTFWMRIAMGLALAEKPEDRTAWALQFYEILSQLRYTPSTPTLFHAGTTYPQLSSCYLNYVSDDLHHIFKVYSDNAQLSKYSGGIGTSWSAIRATGALVKTTNLESQGVVPFLRIANDVNIAINRSGKRRGAACVYLETWHYEIEDFLDLRKNTGDERRRTHDINTANWIPDLFMKRVIADKEWTLFSPDETSDLHDLYGKAFEKRYMAYEKMAEDGKIYLFKKIKAKDLWRKMISMLFETGHPWITFKDPSNIRSPQDHVGVIHNSNLCTEITLNNSREETAVCNIGSVNLANHFDGDKLNTKLLAETVKMAVRMLDNTIDPNFYPTEETRRANMRHRPIGLGIMGFQDALYKLDIDFDSEAAVTFADENMEFISYHTIKTSAELAKEKGAYESFKGSKWDRGIFPIDTLDLLEKERGSAIGVSRSSKLDWKPVRELVAKHGMRNSNTMAVAPTATISNINGCFPTIEPIYKNLYVKSNMSGEFTVVNDYLVHDLQKLGLWNSTMLQELKASDGSVQDITSIPPRLRSKYKTTFEVGMNWLIKIAAYRGKWIDQSQSLNIFFQGTSGKQLGDLYMLAWHQGLKTTYYLRSMGASSVEKSTVDIAKQRIVNEQVQTSISTSTTSMYADQPVQETITMTKVIEPASIPMMDDEPIKACLVNDPDCESCQ
jgi:ribonucleoside-diphosphate reductase alpha chain